LKKKINLSLRIIIQIFYFSALGPRKSLFGPSSSQPSLTSKVSYGSGFVATASDAGGPGDNRCLFWIEKNGARLLQELVKRGENVIGWVEVLEQG
jgi:hypothetical protein